MRGRPLTLYNLPRCCTCGELAEEVGFKAGGRLLSVRCACGVDFLEFPVKPLIVYDPEVCRPAGRRRVVRVSTGAA